jgi:hypothetical protein
MSTEPSAVVGAAIDEMRRQQREEPIITRAVKRPEGDTLQHDIADRIGKHGLVDAIAAIGGDIGKPESRHTVLDGMHRTARVAFLFREIIAAIGDNEAEIARAGIINARIINLVENTVADRVPDAALRRERRVEPALGAGRPACRNAGPAGSLTAHLSAAVCGRMSRSTAAAKPSSSLVSVASRAWRFTASLALPIAMLKPA